MSLLQAIQQRQPMQAPQAPGFVPAAPLQQAPAAAQAQPAQKGGSFLTDYIQNLGGGGAPGGTQMSATAGQGGDFMAKILPYIAKFATMFI